MDIVASFVLGIVGSLHCVGMCGPLMLAIHSSSGSRRTFFAGRLVYHAGKALTYGAMGVVVGTIGKGLLFTIQQDVSIVVGVTMLLSVVLPISVRSTFSRFSPLRSIHHLVKNKFSSLLTKRGISAMAAMGMLNGLLPCGLVYTALIGATMAGDVVQSGAVMFFFGVGTAPVLIAVSMTGRLLSLRFRSALTRVLPVATAVIAVILILRGMNLGIPLISPKLSEPVRHETTVDCCRDR